MTANTTQRVDVERLPSPHWARDLHGETEVFTTEEVAALLQQLAERDAEVERLDAERKQHLLQALENGAAFHAAERAREESCGLLREADEWLRNHSITSEFRKRIAAFLAASGGQDHA